MKRELRMGVLLVLALVTAGALGEEPPATAEVAKPAFEQLVVTIEPFGLSRNGQIEQLRFESNGRCWYKVEGREAVRNIPARNGAVFDHTLSADRIRRLNKLLQDTKWLTAEGAEGRATHTHPTIIRLMLKRDGKQQSIVCEGRRPEPYAALLHELEGVAAQERRIYLHDYVSGEDGVRAWQEIGRELAALRVEPSAKSPFHIDYERYWPIARRTIRDFHGKPDDELLPAVRLAGHFQRKSELTFLHRMAHDRSSHLRQEVAWALGKIHDQESLPVLVSMMSAPGTRREVGFELIQWGDAAVPDIVKLIELSTQEKLEEREHVTGEDMIRAYLEHWDKLSKPIHPEVVTAVRKALEAKNPANGSLRTTYHVQFLKQIPMN
ncbi:MAG: HEAT repeat domain-containing protein [Planctomycetaceae bacterium]|nr:HEAT repeat domain-containing protein [Planctomycetaceae bacterium]